jgi:hypothetical protein
MKIQTGNWEDETLTLSGMPENFILSARKLAILELDEVYKIIQTLEWAITQFDFQNANNELYADDSEELKKAKELLEELKR